MPISLDEDNALEKVARNTYEDTWLADGVAHLRAEVERLTLERDYWKEQAALLAKALTEAAVKLKKDGR